MRWKLGSGRSKAGAVGGMAGWVGGLVEECRGRESELRNFSGPRGQKLPRLPFGALSNWIMSPSRFAGSPHLTSITTVLRVLIDPKYPAFTVVVIQATRWQTLVDVWVYHSILIEAELIRQSL